MMDGYALGGGVGLGVHCSHRVVTENTLFGLPQVAIGLFPDVGTAYILSQLAHPGLGLYLSLTGTKLNGGQCLEYGLASHYLSSNQIADLDGKLGQIKPSMQLGPLEVTRILDEFSKNSTPKKKWNIDLYKIEKYFHGKQNAAEILDHLENEIFRATRKAFKDIKEIFAGLVLPKLNSRFTILQVGCCCCIILKIIQL